MSQTSKSPRILTDTAGYGLLILALLTGWLPGPGGVPLAIAGLGLLSIHNAWARRLRDYALEHGKELAHRLFLDNPWLQAAYDAAVVALLALGAALLWRYDGKWVVALAGAAFGMALGIGLANRKRLERFIDRIKHKR